MQLQRRRVLALGAATALGGCSLFQGDDEVKIEGTRKPVLLLEDSLQPDPTLSEVKVQLPPAVTNPSWPQLGGNAAHNPGHLAASGSFNQVWSADIGDGGRLLSGPIVADGRVYTIDADNTVSAFAVNDGKQVWEYEPEDIEENDRLLGGALAWDGGRLHVALTVGWVVTLDAAGGKEIWRAALGAPIRAAPTVIEGKLLVATADNQLVALDSATGQALWRHAGAFEQAGILGGAAPAADQGIAVVAYSSGDVYALELASGTPLWNDAILRPRRTVAIGSINDISGDPVIDGDRVIVAGAGGETVAFDLRRGDRVWNVEVASNQTPWTASEVVYVLSERNELVCLLQQGGRVRWVTALEVVADPEDQTSERVLWSGPVLVGERLLLASSQGQIVSVSPYTGEIMGRQEADGPITTPIAVAEGSVYFLTDKGDLLAYR
ncbi:MAG: PQQ-binding-like beta-propeller repeat protein [Geminicoccaceae bacterium]